MRPFDIQSVVAELSELVSCSRQIEKVKLHWVTPTCRILWTVPVEMILHHCCEGLTCHLASPSLGLGHFVDDV